MVEHYCEHCERSFTNPRCPRCGGPPSKRGLPQEPDHHDTKALSEDDDSLDTMIEQASLPTLASLLKRGIESGLIKPAHDYSNGVKS